MDASDRLIEKARDYEILAASLAERVSLSPDYEEAVVGFTVVAIVLREVAIVLEEAA